MAFDEKLRFTGASGATTAITTVTTGTALGVGVEVGAERLFLAKLFVPGTAANATNSLAVKFQAATTATGTYADIGYAFETFTQSATAAMGLVIHTTGNITKTDEPYYVAVRTPPLKPWVRVFISPDGTSVQYTAAVVATPIDEPAF